MFLLAESAHDPATLTAPLRAIVQCLDPKLPVSNVRTMGELYRMRVIVLNVVITIIGAMGVMGLALAIVGLYGLVAYVATRRTKEIGITMALGADRFSVLRMVLRQGLVLAASGLAAGLCGSIAAGGGLTAAVFPGVSAGTRSAEFAAFSSSPRQSFLSQCSRVCAGAPRLTHQSDRSTALRVRIDETRQRPDRHSLLVRGGAERVRLESSRSKYTDGDHR
jgi:hypothetical protein